LKIRVVEKSIIKALEQRSNDLLSEMENSKFLRQKKGEKFKFKDKFSQKFRVVYKVLQAIDWKYFKIQTETMLIKMNAKLFGH